MSAYADRCCEHVCCETYADVCPPNPPPLTLSLPPSLPPISSTSTAERSAVCGHVYSGVRTHTQYCEDTYTAACGHLRVSRGPLVYHVFYRHPCGGQRKELFLLLWRAFSSPFELFSAPPPPPPFWFVSCSRVFFNFYCGCFCGCFCFFFACLAFAAWLRRAMRRSRRFFRCFRTSTFPTSLV
jgi:hypothetical protein